jgi:hypothetical protein
MHFGLCTFFDIIVVQPKNVLTHANDIRKTFRCVMIKQVWVDRFPDQSRDIGTHAPLNVQLSYWKHRSSILSSAQSLKLTTVQLVETASLTLER